MRTDVLVVGGGPAGSSAAARLAKGHQVSLLEEHSTPGQPVQCAGLVTPRGIPDFARSSVICEVTGARIHSPVGFILDLKARSTRACVINRALFDRLLFNRAVDAGATPLLGERLVALAEMSKGVSGRIRTSTGLAEVHAEVVVGADGYRSLCRRAAGLPPPKHMLTGIQVDLKHVDHDCDTVDLYFGNDAAPGFFAWSIPAGDLLRLGLCTWGTEIPPAVYLKKLLGRAEFSKAKKVSISSGKIPVGPGRSAASKRIALVGDAACHAKPLSGGGIFTGIKGAELCAAAVSGLLSPEQGVSLKDYDSAWREAFGKELARAFRIRKVFLALNDKKLDKALRMFDDPEVRALLEERGDIDYPASLSSSILKLTPKLAQFSPQIIESLL